MPNMIIAGVVAVALLFGGLLFASNDNAKPQSTQPAFTEVAQALGQGAKLYDVRTADEFAANHFEGALNWSLQDLQAGKLPDVPKDTVLYVYCKSGNRSGQATALLKENGFTNITDLGGLASVQAAGGTLIEKGYTL